MSNKQTIDKMKKIKITALLIVLGAGLAFAQGPRGEHPRGDMMKNKIEHLDSIVDLTDDQKTKITALQTDLKVKMKEARSNQDRDAMKALRDKHKSDIEAILTPEQNEKLKAAKEAKRADMKEMRSELKKYKEEQVKPTMKLKREEFDQLLSEDEKTTISTLRAEMKEIRANKKAEGDGKPMAHDPEQRKLMKEKLEASLAPIVEAHKAELEKVEADLKPLRETWKADMNQIKESHGIACDSTSKKKCDKENCKDACKGKKHKGKKGNHNESRADKATMKHYKFLLMKFE